MNLWTCSIRKDGLCWRVFMTLKEDCTVSFFVQDYNKAKAKAKMRTIIKSLAAKKF